MKKQILNIELERDIRDIIDSFEELGIDIIHFIKIKAREFLISERRIEAGVAELGKGAGLRTLSRRSPRVQITPPA
jgi:hypothetical protein